MQLFEYLQPAKVIPLAVFKPGGFVVQDEPSYSSVAPVSEQELLSAPPKANPAV
jgi:hypothetical protein